LNIVLTGFMGTGKTAVGEKLAKELKMQYVDTDKMIEEDTGTTISKIFKKFGEDHFRDLETQAVKCVAMLDNFVIATGGGAVLREENMVELERNGVVICLSATPEVIYRRTAKNKKRPLLAEVQDAKKKIEEMLLARKPFYERAAFSIDTSEVDTDTIVDSIADFVKNRGKK
jgi:shikimate kinase